MERLTKKDEYGIDIICENCPYHGICADTSDCLSVVLEKLFAYEDTGLTPERCAELAAADRDGRVVVLPCKVGETVFYIGLHRVDEIKIIAFDISETGFRAITEIDYEDRFGFDESDFGKTVFLTRAEAKTALKEQEARE